MEVQIIDTITDCVSAKSPCGARCWWFTPVILASEEAEIRRIKV
jgi:hypothetical protein